MRLFECPNNRLIISYALQSKLRLLPHLGQEPCRDKWFSIRPG